MALLRVCPNPNQPRTRTDQAPTKVAGAEQTWRAWNAASFSAGSVPRKAICLNQQLEHRSRSPVFVLAHAGGLGGVASRRGRARGPSRRREGRPLRGAALAGLRPWTACGRWASALSPAALARAVQRWAPALSAAPRGPLPGAVQRPPPQARPSAASLRALIIF